jgi:hypothetical protein
MNFSNEIHIDTVHVVRRYVVELLYTLPCESLAWETMCSPVNTRVPKHEVSVQRVSPGVC